ncbi:TauD/TfdA family dioxygenase [Gloeobacter morelensis]|uniref:TauD/TfdA family dioxygenase n=1 Tax=Gloeobacter morelensis MG652769 TaxID=2781736 RepID=A0ABY3PME6_9CYAN|nr:TauD/TfdA family dioxygenase [Gloeobacter morelensis]UFP94827.1 TauD/TfdA family dioxygenase [Gloeobacter morelensis MG652769]
MQTTTEKFGTTFEAAPGEDLFALDSMRVIEAFRSTGYVYFSGFGADTKAFLRFSELYCTEFRPYVGGAYSRETIGGDKTLMSVTGHKLRFAVPMHGEMYYLLHHPTVLWFYCATPALSGGETTVSDGIRFWEALSAPTRALFRSQPLKYIRTYPDGTWQGIYQTDSLEEVAAVCAANQMGVSVGENRTVVTEFVTPAFVKTPDGRHEAFINNILPVVGQERAGSTASLVRLEDGSAIPEAVISELQAVAQAITIAVPWKSGDIVMINNTRAMHGRRTFADDQRDIYVRLGDAAFPL